ncbi:MAG: aminotransferase class IV [Neisseriaceae bacterium]
MRIIINDKFFNITENNLSATDRGLLLGDGIFTTLKSINSNLLYFSKHYERLKKHASIISLDVPIGEIELHTKCIELIQLNKLEKDSALIRITITRGNSERGLKIPQKQNPTLIINSTPLIPSNMQPVRLCLTSIIRNEYSPITQIKSLNYLEPILAKNEAIKHGFDDGIMLNTKGVICECSASNIFFINSKHEVITPPLNDGVLNGIIRENVIDACNNLNIPVVEHSIHPDDIHEYKEAFQTNCAIGIQSISNIEQFVFPTTKDSITQIIRNYCKKQLSF